MNTIFVSKIPEDWKGGKPFKYCIGEQMKQDTQTFNPCNSLGAMSQEAIKAYVASIELPEIGSRWLHTNGNIYTVILNTNGGSTRDDYIPTVVYENEDGTVYSKPLETWHRSRTQILDNK